MTPNPYEAPRAEIALPVEAEPAALPRLKRAAFIDACVDAFGLFAIGLNASTESQASLWAAMIVFVVVPIHGALLAFFGRSIGGWRAGVVQRGPLLGRFFSVGLRYAVDLGWLFVGLVVGAVPVAALEGVRPVNGDWILRIASVFCLFALPLAARAFVGSRWHGRMQGILGLRSVTAT